MQQIGNDWYSMDSVSDILEVLEDNFGVDVRDKCAELINVHISESVTDDATNSAYIESLLEDIRILKKENKKLSRDNAVLTKQSVNAAQALWKMCVS